MAEESTTPDLVELVGLAFDAMDRRDFDAVMSIVAPDAVFDGSFVGVGSFEGRDVGARRATRAQCGTVGQLAASFQEIASIWDICRLCSDTFRRPY
jgi:hypothetical protein